MNKQGSTNDQFFRALILAAAAFFLFRSFSDNQQAPKTPPRPAPTLKAAWAGIDPAAGPALTPAAATAALTVLDKDIAVNPKDARSNWDRLRQGLISQYVLKNLKTDTIPSGFLGMGPKVEIYPLYNEIIKQAAGDDIEAQAIYQEGDIFWRRSLQDAGKSAPQAVSILESLIHKGRGSSQFLAYLIYVPVETDPAKVPLNALPATGFKTVAVGDLRGTLAHKNEQGIVDRVNAYYSESIYFKVFDFVVNKFGADPSYSYGLAVLAFAITTRFLLQPLNKKQYESMRGMSVIAPEMKKIQDRYKTKTDQKSQMEMVKEIQALQKRHGVNPYLGCGLAFLQMPIFFLFVSPLIQHYEPKMELAHASFLWIGNLAQRDIPLLVLYGISMFFSFRLSSTPPADDMQKQQQTMMAFAMPIMFPLFISTYPSAFTMYWMTYNVMSTIFQWRLMKAADPKKNVIKTLMGTDLLTVNPTADAVPARPKNDKGGLKSNEASLESTKLALNANLNGKGAESRNGSKNGEVLSAIPPKKKKK